MLSYISDRGDDLRDNILSLIRAKYNVLSAVQQKVADYVLANPQEVILFSLNDLASACDVSETTIFRFLRKLDYSSYQVFRIGIAQEIAGEKPALAIREIEPSDSPAEMMRKVVESTVVSIQDSLQVIKPSEVEKLSRLILQAARVVIIGVGASAAIAQDAHHKMLRLAINAVFCNDPHIMNILCNHLSSDDLLLVVSHSGESREILDAVEFAADCGCKISAVTSYPRSTLSRKSDCVLISSSQETHYRSDAMVSRIIQLVIIDMVCVLLSVAKGDDAIASIRKSSLAVAKNKT